MSAQLLSTSEGATLILTLSNPEHRNALGPEMYAAGVEALSVAESSAEVKSVVITGDGGLFSAVSCVVRIAARHEPHAPVVDRQRLGKHHRGAADARAQCAPALRRTRPPGVHRSQGRPAHPARLLRGADIRRGSSLGRSPACGTTATTPPPRAGRTCECRVHIQMRVAPHQKGDGGGLSSGLCRRQPVEASSP